MRKEAVFNGIVSPGDPVRGIRGIVTDYQIYADLLGEQQHLLFECMMAVTIGPTRIA
jgi:hypothetical protein